MIYIPYIDGDEAVMQFGKNSPTRFTLDFRFPLSPLQAFGIALAAFAYEPGNTSGNSNRNTSSYNNNNNNNNNNSGGKEKTNKK
jgi:hypothetical protein